MGNTITDGKYITPEETRIIYNSFNSGSSNEFEELMKECNYTLPQKLFGLVRKQFGSKLPKHLRVLDAAGGRGLSVLPFHALREETEVTFYGMDIAEKPLEEAIKAGRYDKVRQGNLLEKIPFKRDFFDIVFMCAASEYLPYIDGPVQELARVSKNIVAFTVNTYPLHHPYRKGKIYVKAKEAIQHDRRDALTAISKAGLEQRVLAKRKGWSLGDAEGDAAFYWLVVGKKR